MALVEAPQHVREFVHHFFPDVKFSAFEYFKIAKILRIVVGPPETAPPHPRKGPQRGA